MNKTLIATSAVLLSTIISQPAQAYDQDAIAFGLGYVEALDDKNNGVVGNIEYRSAAFVDNVSWIAGAELDTNTSAYGYGGFLYDLPLSENWSLTPSIAAGLYTKGEGKDLGGTLEFRSNLEVNYKITPESRIGLAINHKSNAGLYDSNPGTETVQVTYSTSGF